MLRRIVLIIGVVLLLAVGGFGFSYQHALSKSVVNTPTTLEISKGDSFGNITAKLLADGVNLSPTWFKLLAYQKGVASKMKAGEYEIPAGATIPQILEMLAEGRAKTYAITFPEGWSLKEILQQIEAQPNLTKTIVNKPVNEIAAALGLQEKNPEGWFFPDTYYFEKHETDVSVLKRAYGKMQLVLHEEWLKKTDGLPYQSAYEALIMASIIEKETGVKSERPRIASVFVNRLRKGMLLQTDPTVIYGMGDKYKGNIRLNDLHAKTPYNTYVITGLPPTPIAMPGRAAIHAALNPNREDSLYFVAKGDGSHQFSVSLADHNKAVNVFQKKINVR